MKKEIPIVMLILLLTIEAIEAQWIDNGTSLTTSDNVSIEGTISLIGGSKFYLAPHTTYDNVLGHYIGTNSYGQGHKPIIFRTSSANRLFIGTNGSIGIGSNSPSSLVHLSSTTPVLTIENSGAGNENQHEVFFKENSDTGMKINYNGSISGTLDRLEFIDRSSGTDNIRAVFQRNGNVGVGSTSPSSLVHLSSTTPVLTIENSGAGNENQHEVFFKENNDTGMKINYNGSISGSLDRLEFIDRTTGTDNIRAVFQRNGNVGIGTTTPDSDALLTVKGAIHSTEIKVLANAGVPDYVFEEGYELRTLNETKEYIKENKHLPEIPSALEIDQNGGFNVGEMNMLLLKKIEELTLYVIEQNEKIKELQTSNSRIDELEKKIELLNKK